MKFGDILIENFLSISTARVILGSRGLVNVEGINKDDTSAVSNGAGKSSFADAISWCLFGVTARGDAGDAVVNDKVGKGCKVDLEIHDDETLYKIIRHRKHKTGKNALQVWRYDGENPPVDLTKGTDKLTQEVVNGILGCSYEVFTGAVYAGQERMPDLPGMTDKQLKVLVEEAAGVTLLEKAYDLAKESCQVAKRNVENRTADLERMRAALVGAELAVNDAVEGKEDWERKRTNDVLVLSRDARAFAEAAKEMAAELKSRDRPAIERELADAKARLKSMDGEVQVLRDHDREVAKAERVVEVIRADLVRLKAQATREKEAVDGIKHRIGCPCGECGKPYVEADLAVARENAVAKLKETVDQFNARKTALGDAQKSLESVTETRESFRASMTDIETLASHSASLTKKLADVTALELARDGHIREARSIKERVDILKVEPNPFAAAEEKARNRLTGLASEIDLVRNSLLELERNAQIEERVAKVFSPAGVRAHILDTVTPFLNDRTAKYLGSLSDGNICATWTTLTKGAKGELKEKFSIEVAHDKGGKRFTSISGGEKRKVRIACALALQDLVASRATKSIELFIGDEIDDALDTAGLERLTMILEEKARERGSVFVISHNDLKDHIRETMTIVKEGGFSTIEGAA